MMAGIEVTRLDLSATDLRKAAGKSRDAKASRRMLALALVLEGVDRTRAAESCGMDRHIANALKVAEFLQAHGRVDWVAYPTLPGKARR